MDLSSQRFDDFSDWVNNATRRLTDHDDYSPDNDFRAICFDTEGRVCSIGAHFMRARDEGSFPVRYIWPDQLLELFSDHEQVGS